MMILKRSAKLGLAVLTALSCGLSAQAEDRLDLNGSLMVRGRVDHNAAGDQTLQSVQYRLILNMVLGVDKAGKVKIIGQARTGKSYQGGWLNSGIGIEGKGDTDLALRQLYVDYSPTENLNIEAGALPAQGDKDSYSFLSFDSDGWADGVRASLSNVMSNIDYVSVTVANVDELTTPNAFERDLGSPNLIRVLVMGTVSERIKFAADAYDFEDEQYLRPVVTVAIGDVFKAIDSVTLESLFVNDDDAVQAYSVSVKKSIAKWALAAGFVHKDAGVGTGGDTKIPFDDFLTEGDFAYFTAARPIGKGKGVLRARTEVGNDSSLKDNSRVEAGYLVKFGISKPAKKAIKKIFKKKNTDEQ